jgi:ABC-type branched-subunit amino acid transport system substrate-binding protein
VDAWAGALIDRVPPGARVTLIRSVEDDLGNHPSLAAEQVFIIPGDDSAVDGLRDDPADVYLFEGDVLSAVSVLTAMHRAGIDAPLWGGPSLARTQLPQIAGAASSGACYVVTAPLLADLSPHSPFVMGYRELSGRMPGPWASLAYDATSLLLDALEQEIKARGRPTRAGVAARLADTVGPDGKPIFVQGQRREAGTKVFCYEPGDDYPGRVSEQ